MSAPIKEMDEIFAELQQTKTTIKEKKINQGSVKSSFASSTTNSSLLTQESEIKPLRKMGGHIYQIKQTIFKRTSTREQLLNQLKNLEEKYEVLLKEKTQLALQNSRLSQKIRRSSQRIQTLFGKVRQINNQNKQLSEQLHNNLQEQKLRLQQDLKLVSGTQLKMQASGKQSQKSGSHTRQKIMKAMQSIRKDLARMKPSLTQISEVFKDKQVLTLEEQSVARLNERLNQTINERVEEVTSSVKHCCPFRRGYEEFKSTIINLLQASSYSREDVQTWACTLSANLRTQFLLMSYFKESSIVKGPFPVSQLLGELAKLRIQPKRSRPLYKLDRLNPASPGRYLTDHDEDLVILIELDNGNVIGAYTETGIGKQGHAEKALLFNFTTSRYFMLKQPSSVCFMDKDSFIIGNKQIVIQDSEKFTSHFGEKEAVFDHRQSHKQHLMGDNQPSHKLIHWQIHQLLFD